MRTRLTWMRHNITRSKTFRDRHSLEAFKRLLFADDKVDWVKTDPVPPWIGIDLRGKI